MDNQRYVHVDNVSMAFDAKGGRFLALKEVDLRVAQGEFVSIIGHSGCGKSTLLNLVAGLLRPMAREDEYEVSCDLAIIGAGPAGLGAAVYAASEGLKTVVPESLRDDLPPTDAEIEAAIRAVGPLGQIPLGEPGQTLDESIVESYVDGAVAVLDPAAAANRKMLAIAYTAMHGVGAPVFAAAFERAGFVPPASVAEQERPDPEFPTVAFPNPEEPGAMDRLIALAQSTGADIAIANDPDADRCAVAIPRLDGWRALRGDEVGVLLADHLLRRGVRGIYATTIVSSTLLSALCAVRGVGYAETLTGFKWIVRGGGANADRLVYGYEEALGYCVAPRHVRDKDGITAALLVGELAAGLKRDGRTLTDRLDELALEFGVHHTDQLSVRVDELAAIDTLMARLRQHPPRTLLGAPVTVTDLAPDADVVILRTATGRVVVRPSGTEPKIKAYLEAVEPVGDAGLAVARSRAAAAVSALRTEVAAALGL